jgi:hypothetical protein
VRATTKYVYANEVHCKTCGVKAYKAITDQRLYVSSGRLFMGEMVYNTKNSTYTELESYVRLCVRCYYYDYI